MLRPLPWRQAAVHQKPRGHIRISHPGSKAQYQGLPGLKYGKEIQITQRAELGPTGKQKSGAHAFYCPHPFMALKQGTKQMAANYLETPMYFLFG